jgi:hypothetical protein
MTQMLDANQASQQLLHVQQCGTLKIDIMMSIANVNTHAHVRIQLIVHG